MTLAEYRDAMQTSANILYDRPCKPPRRGSVSPPAFMFKGMYLVPVARRYTIAQIQRAVADYFGLPFFEMTSARRGKAIARPRQIAMYLVRHLTPKSLPDIGRRFGGRDHSTVCHAIAQIKRLRFIDADLDEAVREIMKELGA